MNPPGSERAEARGPGSSSETRRSVALVSDQPGKCALSGLAGPIDDDDRRVVECRLELFACVTWIELGHRLPGG